MDNKEKSSGGGMVGDGQRNCGTRFMQNSRRNARVACAILIVANILVYALSFSGVFLLDDISQIVENGDIRYWPRTLFLENTRRPFLYLTLTLNYALGGLNPWGYHFFNLLVHVGAALLFFACIYRTCRLPAQRAEVHRSALGLSFLMALFWSLHPLQTQSVTYIIQRAESLCGMFYLVTIFCAINYFTTEKRDWQLGAILACLLGGLTKEVIVTAPLLILLYDGVFISGNLKKAWEKHKALYVGFLIPLGVMVSLFLNVQNEYAPTAGFAVKGMSPIQYLVSQGPVIIRYLGLAIWPSSLIFDYGWKPADLDSGLPLATFFVILLFLAAIVWAAYRPRVGIWAIFFFLILAPSSSIIPLKDLIFENRLYLPLANLVVLFVLAGWWLSRKWLLPRWLIGSVVFILAGSLAVLTVKRNGDYHSARRMWQDTVVKSPENVRALTSLGLALFKQKRFAEARYYYDEALKRDPEYPAAHQNLGVLWVQQGKLVEAERCFRKVIALDAHNAKAYANLGLCLRDQGKTQDAIVALEQSIAKGIRQGVVYRALGDAFLQLRRPAEGQRYLELYRRVKPD